MIEILFCGRGGQGAVTASEMLASAAFYEEKYSHAFPYFQAERKGAPVTAYARISNTPITIRSPIEKADIVMVLDAALLGTTNPLRNLKPKGMAIVNTGKSPAEILEFSGDKSIRINTIDATAISQKVYGQSSIPRVNVAMLGFFAGCTRLIRVESLLAAIGEHFIGNNAAKAKESVELAYGMYGK